MWPAQTSTEIRNMNESQKQAERNMVLSGLAKTYRPVITAPPLYSSNHDSVATMESVMYGDWVSTKDYQLVLEEYKRLKSIIEEAAKNAKLLVY